MIFIYCTIVLILLLIAVEIADCITTDAEDRSYDHLIELEKKDLDK